MNNFVNLLLTSNDGYPEGWIDFWGLNMPKGKFIALGANAKNCMYMKINSETLSIR